MKHKKQRGHALAVLLEANVRLYPEFRGILRQEGIKEFLDSLYIAYVHLRYGEAKSEINGREMVQILDTLAFRFERLYADTFAKGAKTVLYVPDGMRDDFLRDNHSFNNMMVTNNVMAMYLPPGVDIPDFPSP